MERTNALFLVAAAATSLAGCAGRSPRPEALPPAPEFHHNGFRPAVSEAATSPGTAAILPQEVVFFAFDSAQLTPIAREDLDAVAVWLREHHGVRLVVEGHCDRIGSRDYNYALAADRAEAVRVYLVQRGVPLERIEVWSWGEGEAIPRPHDVNRRADLYAATE